MPITLIKRALLKSTDFSAWDKHQDLFRMVEVEHSKIELYLGRLPDRPLVVTAEQLEQLRLTLNSLMLGFNLKSIELLDINLHTCRILFTYRS